MKEISTGKNILIVTDNSEQDWERIFSKLGLDNSYYLYSHQTSTEMVLQSSDATSYITDATLMVDGG